MRKLLMIKIPEHMFRRMDESEDINFYKEPRFVQHIDQLTIDALTSFYGEFIPRQATVRIEIINDDILFSHKNLYRIHHHLNS